MGDDAGMPGICNCHLTSPVSFLTANSLRPLTTNSNSSLLVAGNMARSDAPIIRVHRYLPVSVSNAVIVPLLDCRNRCVSSTTIYNSLSRLELIVAWLHHERVRPRRLSICSEGSCSPWRADD